MIILYAVTISNLAGLKFVYQIDIGLHGGRGPADPRGRGVYDRISSGTLFPGCEMFKNPAGQKHYPDGSDQPAGHRPA